MVILDRLPTKDRLVRFGLAIDNVCGLCASSSESRDHLFVECCFAKEVWDIVLTSCGVCYTLTNWEDLFNWLIANLKDKSLRIRILRLAWTGMLYSVWEERNHRLFRRSSRSVDALVNSIKLVVRVKLSRYGKPRIDDVNRQLCLNWVLDDTEELSNDNGAGLIEYIEVVRLDRVRLHLHLHLEVEVY
ncbi:uncharacterized protein LOC120121568 [Hibiscus syriacus]|uniref:uncharacterized protein LOC120121568 n=1 Tax=Hibiscus syriacus TaxID=106335 RepID=UPI00192247FB|nr:uncharacterized protein LOC120121568 [Hibiscus syriacus]